MERNLRRQTEKIKQQRKRKERCCCLLGLTTGDEPWSCYDNLSRDRLTIYSVHPTVCGLLYVPV